MTPDQTTAVLAANHQFYKAFFSSDLAAMNALWAQHHPVACIHPGWLPLGDRDAVMASWRGIFAGGGPLSMHCRDATALVFGEHALVVCLEVIEGNVLAATNAFVREDGTWRMVHHQSGPVTRRDPMRTAQAPGQDHGPRVLH